MAGESLDALPVGDVVQRHVVEVAEVAEREEVVFLVRCSAFDGDEEQVVGISDADGFADIVRTVFAEAKTFGNVSLQSVREVGKEIHEARVKIPSGTRAELCYAVHAEQNAICQAAKLGISLEGATLYCTHQPCSICAKIIVNSGIKRIVYREGYPDEFAMKILSEADILVERYEE